MQEMTTSTTKRDETGATDTVAGADPTEPQLSPRMREVLALVASGKTHNQTAAVLGISASAVRRYMAQAKFRLGVRTRNEAIVIAVSRGVVQMA